MTTLLANRTVAIPIWLVAILLSSLVFSQFVTGSSPHAMLGRNSVNVSWEQYRAALDRCNSLHVTDYEATIQHSRMGKWKIIVHVDPDYGSTYQPEVQASDSHRIVRVESLDDEAAKLEPSDVEGLTVGGLFDDVNFDLYCQDNDCNGDFSPPPSTCIIEFDPTMGYPRSTTIINEYYAVETRLENVKILK